MKGKKPQMHWYDYCFLISSDGHNVSFIIEQLQSLAMEHSFWAEVILTVLTRVHNYYGLMEKWKASIVPFFCHSFNLVELYNLIVGGSLKII